jgi:hypothetical protein
VADTAAHRSNDVISVIVKDNQSINQSVNQSKTATNATSGNRAGRATGCVECFNERWRFEFTN